MRLSYEQSEIYRQEFQNFYYMINVFCVGAAKSGTTSVYHFLKHYNHIGLSNFEEIDYFSKYFFDWSKEMYESKFDGKNKEFYMDISPSYFSDNNVPERIYNYNPNAQIIVILREPISRMFSHLKMHLRRKNISTYTIDSIQQLKDTRYYKDSQYVYNIQRYKEYFRNIAIFQMEEMINNKLEFQRFKELFNISDNQQFPHLHASGYNPVIPFYYSIANKINSLSKKYYVFNALKSFIRKKNLKRYLSRKKDVEIHISDEVRNLLEKEFRGDILLWKLAKKGLN
jgi:hypothetical protein